MVLQSQVETLKAPVARCTPRVQVAPEQFAFGFAGDAQHGAKRHAVCRAVARVGILEDAELRAEWEAELNQMRARMIRLREKLSEAIRQRSNSKDFDFIAAHRGMFSLLGLENSVVEHLKANNGVYMIGDSRINVAGIPEDRVGELADAMLAAIK